MIASQSELYKLNPKRLQGAIEAPETVDKDEAAAGLKLISWDL